MHLTGWVHDSVTGAPIPGVCVSYGTYTCPGETQTDANGNYELYLAVNSRWGFKFIKPGYTTAGPFVIFGTPGERTQNVFLKKAP